ncbi:flavin reductase family protein [Bosea sp. (in: a-proteobacteria)]|uniref:flavin reductase family protein n=1 Tax=Bosea sp. (in: a-proteobacteria) TaxID=1871050 RepID=UPI003F72DDE5
MTAQPRIQPKPETSPSTVTFDFAALTPRERYKLLIGAVVPRPIALVTTVDAQGVVNAAPFSFFNCLSADPAILALGVEYRPTGSQKDTGRNVRETLAFTVNIVSDALVEGMNVCAVPFAPGIDELRQAGLDALPGAKVPCPWIGQAPAAFECRHHTTLGIGNSREIILGEVVYAHFRADIVDPEKLYVDPAGLDAVGRMGGHGYATTRDYFDLPTLSVEAWRERPGDANRRQTRPSGR